MMSDHDEARRLFLIRALAGGLFAVSPPALAGWLGRVPRQLPPGLSFYSLQGEVLVNAAVATQATTVRPGDQVRTGPGGEAIFVVGQDAFLLRQNSDLQLRGDGLLVDVLRLATGAVLSVFGKSRHQLETPDAVIGIRGTGVYMESSADLSYVCTCYGTVDITASGAAGESTQVVSRHHDAPKYVTAEGQILAAPFINHTDEELMLIETLVGRTPPFALFDDSYGGPRRY